MGLFYSKNIENNYIQLRNVNIPKAAIYNIQYLKSSKNKIIPCYQCFRNKHNLGIKLRCRRCTVKSQNYMKIEFIYANGIFKKCIQ